MQRGAAARRSLAPGAEAPWGPDDAFFALSEVPCHSLVRAGYTYKLCFFDAASQAALGAMGGRAVSLGKRWQWTRRGRAGSFVGGDRCVNNGVVRRVDVTFACGAANRLAAVAEGTACIYTATFETPAACTP